VFTGIIQKVTTVTRLERLSESGGNALKIALKPGWSGVSLGESIAVNGVCLTVTEATTEDANAELHFFIGFETLNRSNLRDLEIGTRVNLERALLATDRLSGHIVQGHVDGEAKFLDTTQRGEAWEAQFELPQNLSRYCVEKGSICLNGVSLTLAQIRDNLITIMLIPHTWEHTNFSNLKTGSSVNVEVDVLAKYMEKLCQPYFKQSKT
jgi:riboflavin synthase